MKALKIYVDASVDCLNRSMSDLIDILPMKIQINNKTYDYGGVMSATESKTFYNLLRDGCLPRTSMIPSYIYEQCFKKALDQGKDVLYLSLGSGISSTYEQALLAKRQLDKNYPKQTIEIIDSKSCSGTLGLLVDRALKNYQAGLSTADNADQLRKQANCELGLAVAEDLFFLQRGGRLSQASAIIGTALKIRPIVYLNNEGKLIVYKKKRGEKQAMRELIKLLESVGNSAYKKAYISHGDNEPSALLLKEFLLEKTYLEEIELLPLTPIIGSHLGPGALLLSASGDRKAY